MASESERRKAEQKANKDRQQRFAEWVELQESQGYTVVPIFPELPLSFGNARVAELPPGPVYNERLNQ